MAGVPAEAEGGTGTGAGAEAEREVEAEAGGVLGAGQAAESSRPRATDMARREARSAA